MAEGATANVSECPMTGVMGVHTWDDDVEPTHCIFCGQTYDEGDEAR